MKFKPVPRSLKNRLTETEYKECDECRVKTGSPTLCLDCYNRRTQHSRYGLCRPPRVCSQEIQEAARRYDDRIARLWADSHLHSGSFTITIVSAPRRSRL